VSRVEGYTRRRHQQPVAVNAARRSPSPLLSWPVLPGKACSRWPWARAWQCCRSCSRRMSLGWLAPRAATTLVGARSGTVPSRARWPSAAGGSASAALGVRAADSAAEVPVPTYELFASTELLGSWRWSGCWPRCRPAATRPAWNQSASASRRPRRASPGRQCHAGSSPAPEHALAELTAADLTGGCASSSL
jgi:hypothetical protein